MEFFLINENSIAIIIIAVVPLLVWVWRRMFMTTINSNTVPGPLALPVIGHMHLIGSKSLHIICEELSHKYGDIFSLQLASRNAIVLCSRKMIHEAFVKNAKKLSGRPDLPTFQRTRNGKTGLSLCDDSEQFRTNRKTAVRTTHSFLANKVHFDQLLAEESVKMLNLLDEYADNKTTFYPLDMLEKVIPSIIVNVIFGKSVNYTDENFLNIAAVYKQWFEVAEADNPADFIPFLENFPNQRLDTVKKCALGFENFFHENFEESKNKDCFVSDYFQTLTNGNNEKLSLEDYEEMGKVISDIIGGGFDTSTSTLSWGILYLLNHTNVLKECQRELQKHDFPDQIIRLSDKEKLPYLSATVYEIIRLSTVAPLGLPRHTTDDINLGGYTINKGTIVLPHLWMANHDELHWEEANNMKPTRFLTNEGKLNRNAINDVLSFSTGIRRCPGDQIAFSIMFVILGTLLNNYQLEMIQPPSDMLPLRGMTLKPKEFKIQLIAQELTQQV